MLLSPRHSYFLGTLSASLFLTLALTSAWLTVGARSAWADIDLNGDWWVTTAGPAYLTCSAEATQTGTALSMGFYCGAEIGSGSISFTADGTINPSTGAFGVNTPGGIGYGFFGTSDGETMSGKFWQCLPSAQCEQGTFQGVAGGAVGGVAVAPEITGQAITSERSERNGIAIVATIASLALGAIALGAVVRRSIRQLR